MAERPFPPYWDGEGPPTPQDVARKADDRLRHVMRCLDEITDGVWIGVWGDDSQGYLSPQLKRTLGYRPDEMRHEDWPSRVHAEDKRPAEELYAKHASDPDLYPYHQHIRWRHKDGQWLTVIARGHLDTMPDGTRRMLGTWQEVSHQVESDDEARERLFKDALTGIGNEAALRQAMTAQLGKSSRTGRPCATLFIDLDRFKPVNDRYGHAAGDDVLRVIAQRLLLRDTDVTARIGGDEFIVFLPEIANRGSVERLARKLIARIGEPIALTSNLNVHVEASIGIVITTYGDVGDIIARADQAMYAAKKSGRNQYKVWHPELPREKRPPSP